MFVLLPKTSQAPAEEKEYISLKFERRELQGGGKLRKTINNGTEYGQVMHLVLDIGPAFTSEVKLKK